MKRTRPWFAILILGLFGVVVAYLAMTWSSGDSPGERRHREEARGTNGALAASGAAVEESSSGALSREMSFPPHSSGIEASPEADGAGRERNETGATLTVLAVKTDRKGEGEVPLPGAEVTVFIAGDEGEERPFWHETATTDERGESVFHDIPAGHVGISARCEGLFPDSVDLISEGWGQLSCKLSLGPGRSLVGRVLERDTKVPIPDARVGGDSFGYVKTDRQGRFRIDGLRPSAGLADLSAWAIGYAPSYRYVQIEEQGLEERESTTDMSPVGEREIQFLLDPGIRARGQVLNEGGIAVVGAAVAFSGMVSVSVFAGEVHEGAVETDVAGRFELIGLRSGTEYRLEVAAEGFGRWVELIGPYPRGLSETELEPIVLTPAGSITGQLMGLPADRSAVLSLAVEPWRVSDGQRSRSTAPVPIQLSTVPSNQNAGFAFEELHPGTYSIEVKWLTDKQQGRVAPPFAVRKTVKLNSGENRHVVLFLDTQERVGGGVPVSGIVTDESGGPIPYLRVVLEDPLAENPQEGVSQTNTDKAGAFRFAVEHRGPFRLRITDPKLYYESAEIEPISPGDSTSVTRLRRILSDHQIRGRLLDESRQPVSGVFVALTDVETGERFRILGIPDATGLFEIANLQDRTFDLELVDFRSVYHEARIEAVRPSSGLVEFLLKRR